MYQSLHSVCNTQWKSSQQGCFLNIVQTTKYHFPLWYSEHFSSQEQISRPFDQLTCQNSKLNILQINKKYWFNWEKFAKIRLWLYIHFHSTWINIYMVWKIHRYYSRCSHYSLISMLYLLSIHISYYVYS